jgi:dolichol kinase
MITNALLYGLTFGLFFVLVELIKRRADYPPEQTRRVVHIGSSLITASMAYWSERWVITILALAFILILSITRVFRWFTSLQGVKRTTIGEFTFAFSTILAAWMLLPQNPFAFAFGYLVLAISDTSAQLVGERWPLRTMQFFGQRKSLGGGAAFFVSSSVLTIGALLLVGTGLTVQLLALMLVLLLGLTFLEILLTFGLDNAVLPVLSGWILLILMHG